MCLRRFISRRGSPTRIFSDNGTAFVGAARKMDELYDFAANRKIEWRFIPPSAPFMGGCWERLVRSVKSALAFTLKQRAPKEEVLHTLLLEAEATVNSRPLLHVPVDPDSFEALTPFHFLLGTPSVEPVLRARDDADLLGRLDWKKGIILAEHFWARWVKEYLPTLIQRRDGHRPIFKIGDPVFIADGTLPRNSWPRGRIAKLCPGPDGVVRVVEVDTKGGTLKRPVRKVVSLA